MTTSSFLDGLSFNRVSKPDMAVLSSWDSSEDQHASEELAYAAPQLETIADHSTLAVPERATNAAALNVIQPMELISHPSSPAEAPETFVADDQAVESCQVNQGANDAGLTSWERIHRTFDPGSPTSQELDKRGYLEPFKTGNCVLDVRYGTDGQGYAVLRSEDGSATRTLILHRNGTVSEKCMFQNGDKILIASTGRITEIKGTQKSA